jgi:hypothetical protein
MDIATQSDIATKFLTVSGYVEPEKFFNFWFMNYEQIAEAVFGPSDIK